MIYIICRSAQVRRKEKQLAALVWSILPDKRFPAQDHICAVTKPIPGGLHPAWSSWFLLSNKNNESKKATNLSVWLAICLDDCVGASMDVGIDARLDCQKKIVENFRYTDIRVVS